MSSFIGHSLAAIAVFVGSKTSEDQTKPPPLIWLGWLVIIAWVPDVDYVISCLQAQSHEGLRITHTLISCQVLPLLTLVGLRIRGAKGLSFWKAGWQASLAGLTHIGLDLLVGVTPLPLLWPLSTQVFRLPFGLLPSAGKISLFNPFFYHNLALELGIMVPLTVVLVELRRPQQLSGPRRILIAALLTFAGRCMYWAFNLSRP